ncbi:hypothetical protein BSL78_27278 [Apostichopus japonicus]|uniref:LRAT domain-containing protein n=1 Tax=Stichopus japonicus TaxID=307972 RepID=A0A2G8JJI9_STIJA|nr:hypothetical protein BSL78_27278 [Apostichopus japonicus]
MKTMQLWKQKGTGGVDWHKSDLTGGVEERPSPSSGTLQADDDDDDDDDDDEKNEGQVKQANNSGLELLTVLEDRGTIGEKKGIDELCRAFTSCQLNRLSQKATEFFNRPRKDIPDGPVETTLTLRDVKLLISNKLKSEDCYEIAIFLGLQSRYVEEIKKSQNSVVDLIDKINDGKDNSDSTINALLFALRNRGKNQVANLILNSEGLPSSIKARASSEEDILPACVCGQNSYKELNSHRDESSVVSLLCNSCAAEWIPTTESAPGASLVWKNNKYSYKIPFRDVSELKHELVEEVNELQRGDHIVFRRAEIYDHHAIFLHKSEKEKGKITVIHWASHAIDILNRVVGGNENPIRINCDDQTFPTGGVKRVQYKECDAADLALARAFDMLNDSSQKYDLAKNNCESLATFCKVGKAFSIQGDVVADVLPYV